ncbi:MAG: glycosyltransferase family 2 protein [Phycisphaeraceae bacterium]|nr:glycosyltransferase family 2 protein [Phycisphaeraceae bacterium]
MPTTPPLTLGMPVRNGQRYIQGALDCLLEQTFGDWSLLISDNASDDSTEDICREYAARDGRITYRRQEANVGAAGNFNFCFDQAASPLFKWLAHDDLFAPEFLSKCIERLRGEADAVIAHSYTNEIDGSGRQIGRYEEQHDAMIGLQAARPSERLGSSFGLIYPCPVWGVMRRDAVAKTRLYGSYLGSDWNFLGEMSLLGRVTLVPEYLFSVRNHETGFSFGFQATSKQTRLAWFDPSRRRPLLSAAESAWCFASAIFRHPMPARERASCLAHLAGRTGGKVVRKFQLGGRSAPVEPSAGAPAASAAGAAETRS